MFGSKKKQPNFKLDLGDNVEDLISGFKGIVIARHQWLHNCNTYSVQPQQLKDGKPVERSSFDEPQLKIVEKKVIKKLKKKTGGPCENVSPTNML